jgi:dsDNA-specific endonuclease/ATPase MutS2
MRERDLQTLEFDKMLSLLADCTLSSAGREASLSLRPQTATERVEAESERTWQFFHLLAACPAFPLCLFPDIRPALHRAAHTGAALEGQKLREILDIVELSRTLATLGQSLGLSMARRLGVLEAACVAAEARLSHEARQLSQAMAKLEEMRTTLERERALAAAELTDARLLVRRLRQEGRAFIATLQQRFRVTPAEQHQARAELAHVIHQQEEAIKKKEQPLPPIHSAESLAAFSRISASTAAERGKSGAVICSGSSIGISPQGRNWCCFSLLG